MQGGSKAPVSTQFPGWLRDPALHMGYVGTETDAENRKILFALGIPIRSFPAFATLASFLFSAFQHPGRPAISPFRSHAHTCRHRDEVIFSSGH